MEVSGSSVNSGPVGAGAGRRKRTGPEGREGVAAPREAGACAARRSISLRTILPLGPLPAISASSKPRSWAIRLARGEAKIRPPTAGAGLGAGDGELKAGIPSFGIDAGAVLAV